MSVKEKEVISIGVIYLHKIVCRFYLGASYLQYIQVYLHESNVMIDKTEIWKNVTM